jgi:hypothetical protein
MHRSMTTVGAESNGMQAQTLPEHRLQHVRWLQLVVVALLIAVVAVGARAVFVQPSSGTTAPPTISLDRDNSIKPHGPNQVPRIVSTDAAQTTSGGSA